MFNKLITGFYTHKQVDFKTIIFLNKLNYVNELPKRVTMLSIVKRLQFWRFRLLRRSEKFEKTERKCAARFFRKYKNKHFLKQSIMSRLLWNIQNKTSSTFYKQPKQRCVWIRFPFTFKTTKALTFFKGRKMYRNEIYLTFKNFTNILFSLTRLVYNMKKSPKSWTINFFLFKKRKLSISKTVDSMVFNSLKR